MWINNVHTFVDNATGLSKYASAIVPVVAGFLNLASIMILGQVMIFISIHIDNVIRGKVCKFGKLFQKEEKTVHKRSFENIVGTN